MNILWDFDGTIFDTYPVYAKFLRQALATDVSEKAVFDQLKVSFSTAFSFFHATDRQIAAFRAMIRACPADAFKPFPHVEEVLAASAGNVMMTHNNRADLLRLLRHYNMDHYFSDIVTGDDGFPRKPDPAAYRYLDQRHPFDLAIGDRVLDIVPAQKLGKKTCLFQNEAPGADFYLNDYADFGERVRL